ncbi:histidine--tRNA ligase [Hydrogenispora ethanolica]|uniref:histidine--tRNA ligase n=1 Tax=Hydrogenispora ethanolica TaxID=1082276 RepID=UPI00104F2088|nr:histidine--tRNA ligase [Hydrogenispora ethanolica]
MKVTKVFAPKGTYDLLPDEAAAWRYLEGMVHRIFREYGYGELRTPIFEHTELFQRGIGETTDIVEKEMFTFTDRGERSITLRPEGTASIVRAYLEHNLAAAGGVAKLYYYGPMFRCEAPQAGRFRQFSQFGVEALGSSDPRVDAEVIALAVNIYRRLGISDLEININSIGCPTCRPLYRERLLEHLRPHVAEMCPNCQRRLERNPLRLLDCKNENCKRLTDNIPLITETLCSDCGGHFQQLMQYLDGIGVRYRINPRLVRGFDYYTKTVFEVVAGDLGAQNALCGGGRYDGLIEECGGPPTPGIGFAAGMERLMMVLKSRNLLPQVKEKPQLYLAPLGMEARQALFPIMIQLREAGWIVETDLLGRSLKAQLKSADKLGVPLVGVLGEDELRNGQILIRHMDTSQQELVPITDLVAILKKKFQPSAEFHE